jgi:hypothetical protein
MRPLVQPQSLAVNRRRSEAMHRPAYHGPVPPVPTATPRSLSSHDPVARCGETSTTTLIIALQLARWESRVDLSHASCRRVPHCGECTAGGPSHVEVIPRRSRAAETVCPRSRGDVEPLRVCKIRRSRCRGCAAASPGPESASLDASPNVLCHMGCWGLNSRAMVPCLCSRQTQCQTR